VSVIRRPAALLAALLAVGSPAAAQNQRSFEASRSNADSTPLQVRVTYDAGFLGLRAGAPRTLYDVRLQYDAAGSAPLYTYSAETRSLHVGSKDLTGNFPGPRSHGDDSLRVSLGGAPLDLALELGAVGADVNLTGLRIRRLKLESGASDATVRFDSLNVDRMSLLDLQAGVARLRVLGLANANADEIRVRTGVGSVELDFGGAWTHDTELTLDVALGTVVLRVPSDVGIQLELRKTFTKVEAPGLTENGGVWQSANWASASRKLHVRAHTTMGAVRVERR
jgi:Cell wall-active antibiotics response 4TMS YvqF